MLVLVNLGLPLVNEHLVGFQLVGHSRHGALIAALLDDDLAWHHSQVFRLHRGRR